jgi:hypothetical protein
VPRIAWHDEKSIDHFARLVEIEGTCEDAPIGELRATYGEIKGNAKG